MIKNTSLILLLLLISGCTAHLRETSFIAQDTHITEYSAIDLTRWQTQFPNHTLKPLSLKTHNSPAVLKGILIDHPESHDIIYFIQGNGMRVSPAGIKALENLSIVNKDIVIFDRRGLGASSGHATIDNLISDAVAQYHFIQNSLKPEKLIVHGYSLGSFIAAQLAKNVALDALILQGSATNVEEWISHKMPWYSKLFVTVEIEDIFKTVDNKKVVAEQYHKPLLIIGGENDQQVPVELSHLLYAASRSTNKQLIIAKDADHNNMLAGKAEMLKYEKFVNTL